MTQLERVVRPNGSTYEMGYQFASCGDGVLDSLTLPTLGRIEYGYSPWQLPTEGCDMGGVTLWAKSSPGVTRRTFFEADGTEVGTWTYGQQLQRPAVPTGLCSGEEDLSLLARRSTWAAIDQHTRCRSWQELRRAMQDAPGDAALTKAADDVAAQLRRAWNAGRSSDLPAELAAVRALWRDAEPQPVPLLKGDVRAVLLATDSLTGEFCASLVARFLALVQGVSKVVSEAVPGFHPFSEVAADGRVFTRMAQVVSDAVDRRERLLMVPLGGTKLHLPLMTLLATRLSAPMVLGHFGLDRPVVVPWLESDGRRVRGAGLGDAWPELSGLPAVRLEVDDG